MGVDMDGPALVGTSAPFGQAWAGCNRAWTAMCSAAPVRLIHLEPATDGHHGAHASLCSRQGRTPRALGKAPPSCSCEGACSVLQARVLACSTS